MSTLIIKYLFYNENGGPIKIWMTLMIVGEMFVRYSGRKNPY